MTVTRELPNSSFSRMVCAIRERSYLALTIALVGVIGLIAAIGVLWLHTPPRPRADPANAQQVALGRAVYAQHCASCHGANLEGQPNWRRRRPDGRLPAPPHDASGHTWEHTEGQLFEVIKFGIKPFVSQSYETDMRGFSELDDAKIWAVIAFIRSTWPPEIEELRRRMDAAEHR